MKSLLLIAAVLVAGALALQDGQVCEPGANFKVDCNTCRCSADGLLMSCTRKFCVQEEQSDDPKIQAADWPVSANNAVEEEQLQTNGQVCTPNEVKMEDCNRCKCAANGIGWFCTRRACPQREKRDVNSQQPAAQQCVPGQSFKSADGCNNCFCNENGIAACTMKFCFPKTKREVPARRKDGATADCVPGTSFKSSDGCNDCFCTEDGTAACTLMFCLGPQEVKHRKRDVPTAKKCTPGEVFQSEDGCNSCRCTETGVAACTEKLCLKVPRTKRSSNDEPLPGSKIAPGTEGFSCTPGKSFKFQCNTCRCDATGKSAACTYKYCLPNENDES